MSKLTQFLEKHEGRRGDIYDDATGRRIQPGTYVKGHPTTGIGFALNNAPLDDAEIDFILNRRAEKAEKDATRIAGKSTWLMIGEGRRIALAAMAYQLGAAGLEGFHDMLGHLRRGEYRDAAREALDSDWAAQTPDRAKETAEILKTGDLPEAC